jgi:hypothetical protein
MHNLQPWVFDESPWEVVFVEGRAPKAKPKDH